MGAKIELDTSGFMDGIMKQLRELEADTKTITENALKAAYVIVTEKAEEAVEKANLPAGGKYSTGQTLASLYRDGKVHWAGTEAYIDAGFSIKEGGIASIFMIYGTPRHMKNQKLYDIFNPKGNKALRTEIQEEQERIFLEALRELRK